MPSSISFAIAPAAVSGAVILPENCPPPRMSWAGPYFSNAGKSACPGLGIILNFSYFEESVLEFLIWMTNGIPVVTSSFNPASTSTLSSSFLGVPMSATGFLQSTSFWI